MSKGEDEDAFVSMMMGRPMVGRSSSEDEWEGSRRRDSRKMKGLVHQAKLRDAVDTMDLHGRGGSKVSQKPIKPGKQSRPKLTNDLFTQPEDNEHEQEITRTSKETYHHTAPDPLMSFVLGWDSFFHFVGSLFCLFSPRHVSRFLSLESSRGTRPLIRLFGVTLLGISMLSYYSTVMSPKDAVKSVRSLFMYQLSLLCFTMSWILGEGSVNQGVATLAVYSLVTVGMYTYSMMNKH